MWKFIQFAVVFLGVWVGYYYFFGNDVQKQRAEIVTNEAKEGIVALANFAKENKDQLNLDNLKDGTQKIGSVLRELGAKAQAMDEKCRKDYEEMKVRKQQLDDLLTKIDQRSRDAKEKKQQINDEMTRLIHDMEKLTTDLEKEENK